MLFELSIQRRQQSHHDIGTHTARSRHFGIRHGSQFNRASFLIETELCSIIGY